MPIINAQVSAPGATAAAAAAAGATAGGAGIWPPAGGAGFLPPLSLELLSTLATFAGASATAAAAAAAAGFLLTVVFVLRMQANTRARRWEPASYGSLPPIGW